MKHVKVLDTSTCQESIRCCVLTYQLVGPYRQAPEHIFNHLLSLVGDQIGEREIAVKLQPRRRYERRWGAGRGIASCHHHRDGEWPKDYRAAVYWRHRLFTPLAASRGSRSAPTRVVRYGPGICGLHPSNFTDEPWK